MKIKIAKSDIIDMDGVLVESKETKKEFQAINPSIRNIKTKYLK